MNETVVLFLNKDEAVLLLETVDFAHLNCRVDMQDSELRKKIWAAVYPKEFAEQYRPAPTAK